MMNEKWEEQFREQIHDFVETIEKFDKARSTGRHTRESPEDSEAMRSGILPNICCVSEWQAET